MKVVLTGATGYIGSHVLTELHEHGHEVTALVQDGARADIVAARGAKAAVADLYDRPAVVSLLEDADAAIHTASPGDATTADLDSAVADAVIESFGGTGKTYIEISGAWAYGDLDQGTGAAKARAELGWYPSHPSLTDEFRHGSYRK